MFGKHGPQTPICICYMRIMQGPRITIAKSIRKRILYCAHPHGYLLLRSTGSRNYLIPMLPKWKNSKLRNGHTNMFRFLPGQAHGINRGRLSLAPAISAIDKTSYKGYSFLAYSWKHHTWKPISCDAGCKIPCFFSRKDSIPFWVTGMPASYRGQ